MIHPVTAGATSAHACVDAPLGKIPSQNHSDEWSRWSDREIARQCGVSDYMVRSLRGNRSDNEQSDERTYTTRHGTEAAMNTTNIGRAAADDRLSEIQRRHIGGEERVLPSAEEPHNHRAQGTGENEWYTPADFIKKARSVMGNIDLDPASSEQANEIIGATHFFDQNNNGLEQEWAGNVWLNPPYAQPAIHRFAEKASNEWTAGHIEQAIVLTHNYTDTRWFHILANACTAICFTRGRIGFLSPEGEKAAPTQGQAFFYFGENVAGFAAQFFDVGFIVKVRHE